MYPYTTYNLNTQEIINEMMVLTTLYVLFLYTEFVPEAAIRYNIGWGHIGMLVLNVIFNLGFMSREIGRTAKLKCMKYSYDKHVKAQQKRAEELAIKKAEAEKIAKQERQDAIMALF